MGKVLSNETRDKILFDVAVLGATQKETAEKFGCTVHTVSQQTLVFNKVKARDWEGVKAMMRSGNVGINLVEWAIGRTKAEPPKGFIEELKEIQRSEKRKREKEPPVPPNIETVVKEPPKPENPVAGAKTFIPAPSAEVGWQTRIEVKPDRLCMKIYFNGVQQVEGFSRIKENKELALVQAISYAAHMCYKIVEQRKLGGK